MCQRLSNLNEMPHASTTTDPDAKFIHRVPAFLTSLTQATMSTAQDVTESDVWQSATTPDPPETARPEPFSNSGDVHVFQALSERRTVYFVILLITYMLVMCFRKHMQNNEDRFNYRIAFRLDNYFSLAAVAICVWLYHELTQAALCVEPGWESQKVLKIWNHVFVGFFQEQKYTQPGDPETSEMEKRWYNIGLAFVTWFLHVPILEYLPSIFGIGWCRFYAVDVTRRVTGIALQCMFLLHMDKSVATLDISYGFLSQFTYTFVLDQICTGGGMFHVFNPVKAALAVYDYICSVSGEMGVKLAAKEEKISHIYHLVVAVATAYLIAVRVLRYDVPALLGFWTEG